MVSRAMFGRHVKDALTKFYDPVYLQTHPMADLLSIPDGPEQITRAQLLRQALRDAIERLRPDDSIPFGRPEWLGYRILWLRYVECLDQPEVCDEVALSRASFYRYHREALKAVTSLLWNQHEASLSTSAMPGEQELSPEAEDGKAQVTVSTERARIASTRLFAEAATQEWVDIRAVVARAEEILAPLLEQQDISLHSIYPPSLPALQGDPALLRQILLNVLTEGIKLATGPRLHLETHVQQGDIIWRLRGIGPIDESELDNSVGLTVSKELLGAYKGQLWAEEAGEGFILGVTIPVHTTRDADRSNVLIIDDDPDTTELYCRYLRVRQYRVSVAHTGPQARELLAENRPDIILLDVLMPGEDGWDILQYLRTTPESADIPVIVCSVLSQPHLALVSGATAVLQKPIDQAILLRTVQKILETGNEAPEVRAVP